MECRIDISIHTSVNEVVMQPTCLRVFPPLRVALSQEIKTVSARIAFHQG